MRGKEEGGTVLVARNLWPAATEHRPGDPAVLRTIQSCNGRVSPVKGGRAVVLGYIRRLTHFWLRDRVMGAFARPWIDPQPGTLDDTG